MTIGDRISAVSNRFYGRIRHPDAWNPDLDTDAHSFDALRGNRYCLVATFRRSGERVPTPVWFGLADDGKLYFRSEAKVGKIKRIRNDGRVEIAPCNARGKPLGPAIAGQARIVDASEEQSAEAAVQSNYGRGRRIYEGAGERMGVDAVYVEVSPRAATAQPSEGAT